VESPQTEEVDGRRGPFPLWSCRALLASRVMYRQRNRRRSTCRDLAGREPRKKIEVRFF
jgi:hypothetical protein